MLTGPGGLDGRGGQAPPGGGLDPDRPRPRRRPVARDGRPHRAMPSRSSDMVQAKGSPQQKEQLAAILANAALPLLQKSEYPAAADLLAPVRGERRPRRAGSSGAAS